MSIGLENKISIDSNLTRALKDEIVFTDRKFLLILFVLNIVLRFPTFYTPILDIDESQFAGFAHVLMDGGLPYRESLDTKPLGIYWFYKIVFETFGRTNMGMVHVVTALLVFISALLLYRSLTLLQHRIEGKLSALILVVFSTTFIPKYLATSINGVMMVFLCAAFYFVCRFLENNKLKFIFLSGLFSGMAFLFKYTAGIQLIFFGLLSALILNRKSQDRKLFVKQNVFFGIAFFLPFVVHVLYLWQISVLDDFIAWSILGSSRYVANGGATISFLPSFMLRFGSYALATLPLWYYAIRAIRRDTRRTLLGQTAILWFGVSLVPVFVGARFYSHYFLHALPALCVLASLSLAKGLPNVSLTSLLKYLRITTYYTLLAAILFLALRIDHKLYLNYFPDDQIYEQQKIGLTLKQRSNPDDRAFVWGFATSIYFYSGLKPASRFLWSDLLTGRTPGPDYARKNLESEQEFSNPEAWENFMADLERHQPRFFIDTSPANIHNYGRFPIQNYTQLMVYLEQYYSKVDNLDGVDIYERKLTN